MRMWMQLGARWAGESGASLYQVLYVSCTFDEEQVRSVKFSCELCIHYIPNPIANL
jgi:hypothetical protein